MEISTTDDANRFLLYSSSGFLLGRSSASSVDATATTSTQASAGTWAHACAVFTNITSRTIYLNAAGSNTNVTSNNPATFTNSYIGSTVGTSSFINGSIAFVSVWNIALSLTDITSLASGISPRKVHPEAIQNYVRMVGGNSPEPDYCNATGWTLVAAPTLSASPRIYTP